MRAWPGFLGRELPAVHDRFVTGSPKAGRVAAQARLGVPLRYGELSLSRARALASPARRLYSSAAPLRRQVRQRPSSSGPGRRPFTAKTGVRFPLGAPIKSRAYGDSKVEEVEGSLDTEIVRKRCARTRLKTAGPKRLINHIHDANWGNDLALQ